MNFWTFLDRNFIPMLFFIVLPLMIIGVCMGPHIVHELRTPPKCEEAK